SDAEWMRMLKRRSNPVIREQNKHLLAETGLLMIVLVLLYSFTNSFTQHIFPGLFLVAAIVLSIINHFIGRFYFGRGFNDDTIGETLRGHQKNVKAFTVMTLILRSLAGCSLVIFLISTIKLDMPRIWLLRTITLVFLVNLALIIFQWIKRALRAVEMFYSFIYGMDMDDN
ncbi:MAG: hypothetical protein J7527_18045, partial [Chitinophagaceae bacterium]|nr:hypothetical protein [Chitinophagaceae bacterium]